MSNELKELENRVSELESELKDIKSTIYTPDKEAVYKAKFELTNNPLRYERLTDPIVIRMKPDKFIKYNPTNDYPRLAFKLDKLSTGKLLARLVGGDDRLQELLSSLCKVYLVQREHYSDPSFNIYFEADDIYRIEEDGVPDHINMLIHDKNKFQMINDLNYYKSKTFYDWCCYGKTDEIEYDEILNTPEISMQPAYLRFEHDGGTDLWIDATIGYKCGRGSN